MEVFHGQYDHQSTYRDDDPEEIQISLISPVIPCSGQIHTLAEEVLKLERSASVVASKAKILIGSGGKNPGLVLELSRLDSPGHIGIEVDFIFEEYYAVSSCSTCRAVFRMHSEPGLPERFGRRLQRFENIDVGETISLL